MCEEEDDDFVYAGNVSEEDDDFVSSISCPLKVLKILHIWSPHFSFIHKSISKINSSQFWPLLENVVTKSQNSKINFQAFVQ